MRCAAEARLATLVRASTCHRGVRGVSRGTGLMRNAGYDAENSIHSGFQRRRGRTPATRHVSAEVTGRDTSPALAPYGAARAL